ncbi:MAG: polyamine ABC transporter substrate-binding protein [Wenzhouxiangellaceae bacterium]
MTMLINPLVTERRRIMRAADRLIACCCLLLLAACEPSQQDQSEASAERLGEEAVVYVYNWSDYIDEQLLDQFERETGIEVIYDVFDSNALLEAKLLTGGSGYDVVTPSAVFLSRQIAAGAFQPLRREWLPNWDQQWQEVMTRTAAYDPGNRHAINYMWGTTGIGHNAVAVTQRLPQAPVDSWALVFDPANTAVLADCGIHFVDAPDELIPAALAYLGIDPNSHDYDALQQAEQLLLRVRPYIRKFHSSSYINDLANGDICVAVGWSGDILQAAQRAREAANGVDIIYRIPREGARMWFDMMAIPVDAPHPRNAHRFLDFLLRGEVIAAASNKVYFANGNLAAQRWLNEDVFGDPAIYPPPAVMQRLFTITPYPADVQRQVTRLWINIKTTSP